MLTNPKKYQVCYFEGNDYDLCSKLNGIDLPCVRVIFEREVRVRTVGVERVGNDCAILNEIVGETEDGERE